MKKLTLIATSVAIGLGLSACSPAEKATQEQIVEHKEASQAKQLHSGIDHSAMNTQVRPQNDLYRYVSGHWLENTEIPGDKSRYGVFNMLHDNTQDQLKILIQEAAEMDAEKGSNNQKLGDMYNSYMDVETANQLGISPIEEDINGIAAVQSHSDVASKMGELFALGVQQPFGFYVYPDAKDPSTYGMWLYQSGLSLPDRDYYFKDEAKFEKFRSALTDYVADLLSAAGHENASEAAEAVVALEKRIAEQHLSRVESRDAEKNYNKRSVAEVKALLDGFDWQAYANTSGLVGVDHMIVRQLPYFEAMGELFSSTDVSVWKDYLTYKLVDTYAPRLHQELVDRHFDFHSKTLNGIPEQRPRWKRAVSATSGVLGEVLGQQYVARHFKPEAKAKMEELVGNLILAYEQSIRDLDWMTEETKKAALEKLSKFNPKIGYPDKWRDYSALTISDKDLVGNYKRYNRFEQDYQVGKIGQEVDPVDWGMTPQTINAYYSPTRNEIVFPAAILQPPFFDLEAEDAVNYGAIGAVIGHEIGHGFDDQGSKYDGDGNLRSWWTEEDRKAFDALGAKLAEQFDQYEPIEGQTINGKLTLGENIGDLAGLTIAHKAYDLSLDGKPSPEIDDLSGDQRFFMGWAQVWRNKMREDALRAKLIRGPHSPGEYRVNGTVINIDSFHEAFDVKEGDAMYLPPEERVQIW
ncbi:Putative zinc metalloproteinase in scaA 5'region [Saliniradius amylolyticus]|uniref:Zinc metalloproteinase in scaA 5'region n=1 Tax=Saliniradius amylolyticus TaxID=2183582 RepID=A0A2S2E7G2_9ALTE|nr:M13 family metallopeptidase [Saliniradius amylolyticus]AWL12897.1 Putative zinc metalloproteinase in scaA 5'region [Saliniradius amylolyticus]